MTPTNYLATFRISGRGIAIKQWWMNPDGTGEWRYLEHREGEGADAPPRMAHLIPTRRPRK